MKLLLTALLLTAATLHAQTAPLPAQLHSAKTVFLSLGPGFNSDDAVREYTGAYNALAKAGYTLEPTPAQAELSVNLSCSSETSVSRGDSRDLYTVHLDITDIKTHTTIWTIDTPVESAFLASTAKKNEDSAVLGSIATLSKLASETSSPQ